MKTKHTSLCIAAAVVIVVTSLIYFTKYILFPHKEVKKPLVVEGASPERVPFIDVTPISYHPSQRQQIAFPDGEAVNPRVSPDGSKIVLVVRRAGKGSLAIVELPAGKISTIGT